MTGLGRAAAFLAGRRGWWPCGRGGPGSSGWRIRGRSWRPVWRCGYAPRLSRSSAPSSAPDLSDVAVMSSWPCSNARVNAASVRGLAAAHCFVTTQPCTGNAAVALQLLAVGGQLPREHRGWTCAGTRTRANRTPRPARPVAQPRYQHERPQAAHPAAGHRRHAAQRRRHDHHARPAAR